MDTDFYVARELAEQVMARAAMTPTSRAMHARRASDYRDLLSHHRAAAPTAAPAARSGLRG